MSKPQPRRHALLQARVVAAVGLISVGGGIGLALMLARTLVWVGFGVALASEFAVFWIYWEALRSLYRSSTKHIPYRGPGLEELAVSTVLALLMTGISIAVFSTAIAEQPPAGRASLEFGTVEFVKLPQSSPVGTLNVQFKNAGNLNAERLNLFVVGHVRSELVPQDQLDKEMLALEDAARSAERGNVPGAPGSQLRPGSTAVISLQDFDPSKLNKVITMTLIQLTDDQWRDFENGKSAIYVLFVAHYEDEAHASAYWNASSCLYFAATRAFWHNCGSNRIDLVNSARAR